MSQKDIVSKGPKMKGTVKQVYSGDRIVVYGPLNKQGIPFEKVLQLVCLRAPRTGIAGEKKNENNGLKVKNYLRRLIIGQTIEFYIEEKMNGYEVASIFYMGQELSCKMLSEGMGQFQFKKENKNIDLYKECEEKAKSTKKGVWGDHEEGQQVEIVENLQEFCQKNKQINGFIDYISNGHLISIQYSSNNRLYLIKAEMDGVIIPKLNADNQSQLKYLMDKNMLQRDVQVKVKGISNNGKFIKVDISLDNSSFDIYNEVLASGFGRINVDGIKDKNKFKEYQRVQEKAQISKVGMWSDFIKAQTLENNEFQGQVQEIISGDQLVILNLDNNQAEKYFLSNFKAPTLGNAKKNEPEKPYAFESKEELRKLTIGKKVNVTVDYIRKIQSKENDKELTMKFVTLVISNICVQVLLAKQGLGNVIPSKQNEECSKYVQEMKTEEEAAQLKKLNIFNPKQKPIQKFNEISQKNGKQFESFVKGDGKINGVVDFVLSGQRIKIRLIKHNAQILVNLQGIKTMPNDANIILHKEWSNKAMIYARQMINQRDIEIEIENCDNKGVFYGTLWVNNRNFNADLVEQGLAHVFSKSKYTSIYQNLEKQAKSQKRGIWGTNIQFSSQESKELNYEKKVIITEVKDPQNLYLQSQDENQLAQIEKVIDQLNMKMQGRLENPIKKDTPCLALFDADGLYYRAKIMQKKGTGYQVHFSDYGNSEIVESENIHKIPQSITEIPNQCDLCEFAFIKSVSLKHEIGQEIKENLIELLQDKELIAEYVSQDNQHKQVVLYLSDSKNPKESVNAKLVSAGYAKIQDDVPEKWAFLAEVEEKASSKKIGIWMFDDEDDD